MFSYSRALVVGALLAGVASADSDNFIMTQVRTLAYTRVDPLVYPGANGPHIHTVVGGSKFDPDCTTTACLRQSKCSSSMVQADKSAYWSPTLFYKFPNGTLATMPSSTRIYYFFKGLNGTASEMHPFPENFRMVAGPPSDQRPAVYPPRGELGYDQLQAMDPRVAAIKWGCSAGAVQGQGSGGSLPGQRPYLPNDAPNGCGVVNAGIFYPSCNDGRLDSPDHFDHMRYPLDGTNGYNCPPSHPIKFPTMFMEHFYFPPADQPFHGEGTWILSSGDDTGLAYHADFINGWDAGVFESVVAQCNAPNAPADNLSACGPLGQNVNVDAADQCRSEGRIVYEEVGLVSPISQFPGCNNWPDNEQTKPACNAPQVEMGQPTGRYDYTEFKLSLPIANASTVNNAPQASVSDTYSYSYSSTSAAPSTTSSASSTGGAAAVKDLSTSSSASSTTSTYDYNYGAPAQGTATSSATSTTTASYDYNYGAPASGTTTSTASPTNTDYNYGAPSAETSSSSAVPSTTDYNYGAPPPAGASPASTSVSSSVAAAAAAPAATSSSAAANSPASSVSTSATTTPSAHNAGVVGAGPKPQKTCRPKHKGHKGHGQHHRRRNLQKRLIN